MAGNFAKPVDTDLYTSILTLIRENQTELAKMLDGSTAISIPSGAKRWNETNKQFEKYNGTSWSALMPVATQLASGLMSAADKVKIDALGTASTVDKQTSSYDDTAGSLLLNGAFGLAGTVTPLSLSTANALDTIANTSVYNVASANVATVNGPAGASAGAVFTIRYSSAYAHQTYYSINSASAKTWTRQCNNGTWSEWAETLNTANISNAHIPVDSTHRWATDAEKTAWNAKAAGTHTHVLNDLTNVAQASAAVGELLKFDGTNWINNTLAEAGIAAAAHTHLYAGAASAGGAASTATKLATARTISLTGDVSGSAPFDGSAAVSIAAVVANDSHTHSTYAATSHTHSGYLDTDLGAQGVGSINLVYGDANLDLVSGSTYTASQLNLLGFGLTTIRHVDPNYTEYAVSWLDGGGLTAGTWRYLSMGGTVGSSGYVGGIAQRIS